MTEHVIGIVGAGPASLYAAEKLLKSGHQIVILNRDIKHGGLAEFGIYPNKYKMKIGLRKVFHKILSAPNVHYFGDIVVGQNGDLTLEELNDLGFSALIVAVGAQGTKWLGLPGEDAAGVYHAKDLVYHYNNLPPFSEQEFKIGQRTCVVGLGNVALDIVHWLVYDKQVAEVTMVARRGPGERAYTDKEMKIVASALDLPSLEEEFASVAGELRGIGQDPEIYLEELRSQSTTPPECETRTKLKIRYLRSPSQIHAEDGEVRGLICDVMRLEGDPENARVRKTGGTELIPCETIVFAIGDSIEPAIGLPLSEDGRTFATLSEPWSEYPDRERYRVRDPSSGEAWGNVFVVGWARKASDGLVGKARQDAGYGCDEIEAFLNGAFGDVPSSRDLPEIVSSIEARIRAQGKRVVTYEDIVKLEKIEAKNAEKLGIPEFKFSTRAAILEAIEGDS